MKIALITDLMDDRPAGMGHYIRSLAGAMLDQGTDDEFYLIHAREGGDPIYDRANEIVVKPSLLKDRLSRKSLHYPRILKKHSFDLVHYPDYFGPFFSASGFSTVETIYDMVPFVMPEVHTWDVNFTFRKVFPRLIQKHVDRFLCISRSTERDLLKFVPDARGRTVVTLLAADPVFKPEKNAREVAERMGIDGPFILNVGTLEPRKNQAMLVRSFLKMKQQRNLPHTLVLAGKEGWLTKEIHDTVKRSGMDGSVRLLDYVRHDDLPGLYSAADLFVYPSLYEGFGLPPLEAMACGAPVITSNVSSLPEVVGDAGMTLDPHDEPGLSRAMGELLEDRSRLREMSRWGLKRSADFSWERCAQDTLEAYRSIPG